MTQSSVQGITINNGVRLKQEIAVFHHQETPQCSLQPVLAKLQTHRILGRVRRVDDKSGSVGVQFPRMRELLWFKPYELVKLW